MMRGSRFTPLWRLLGIAIGAASLAGCGASAAMRAAEDGNLIDLRRTIGEEIRRDELSADEARAIARAVASLEAEHAAGPVGADRIRDLQTCARQVSDALERRASASDELAAVAALVLLEEGLATPEEMALRAMGIEKAAAPSSLAAAWRAVRARTLTKPEDSAARRALMLDADQDVRAAATRAALDAALPADTDALIEAARLDPHPVTRTLAIRGLGAIGGERVVLALKDMWAFADEPKRQVIVVAWAMPRAINVGGRRELTIVAESQTGTPALAAAIALARAGGGGSSSASGVIERAIASGSTRDRVYAISASPLGSERVREAIGKAQGDADEAVALAALSRRVEAAGEWRSREASTERGAAIAKLLRIAKEAQDTARGRSAKGALARGRVRGVLPLLERDAQSKNDGVRESAGMSLTALGELPRASLIAADVEPRVRTRVACAILRAPR